MFYRGSKEFPKKQRKETEEKYGDDGDGDVWTCYTTLPVAAAVNVEISSKKAKKKVRRLHGTPLSSSQFRTLSPTSLPLTRPRACRGRINVVNTRNTGLHGKRIICFTLRLLSWWTSLCYKVFLLGITPSWATTTFSKALSIVFDKEHV